MSRPVLAALLLLALAGCSTPEKSSSLPPLTPAPSTSSAGGLGSPGPGSPGPGGGAATASPTASATPVVKPPEADRPDGAGAEAFARYWFDELNAAYDSMQTQRLSAVSEPACQTCRNYVSSINAARDRGHSYVGGEVIIRQLVAAPPVGDVQSVIVNLDANEGKEFDQNGKLLLDVPAEHNTAVDLRARRSAGRWVVAEVVQVQ